MVDQAYGSVGNAGNITYVGYYNFSGNIDNLSVWETAITQQEVINYMNCPPIGNESE